MELEFEKRFKWIVFLPRKHSRTGALNRYYGVDTDGDVKIQGVKARRSDSPKIVKKFQREVLHLLAEPDDREEFRSKLREAEALLDNHVDDLENGDVPTKDLTVTSTVSKRLEDYIQYNFNAAAFQQSKDLGAEKKPGERVQYVVRDADFRNRDRVVLLEEKPGRVASGYYREQSMGALESIEP